MERFSLEALLKGSGRRMKEDLAQQLAPHPGEVGAGREAVVRRFLQAYLPKRFVVSSGFAFDSKGGISKQLDIIIADSLVAPVFEDAGGSRFFPCESIVAVGQVKSSITSKEELREAFANLESAKVLDRSAGGKAIAVDAGEPLNPIENHLDQIFSFLFITGDSLAPETLRDELLGYVLSQPAHVWPNVIFSFNKCIATFCCDGGVCPNPLDARGIALQLASEDDEILMRFYLLLGSAIQVTRVSRLPYWEYLQRAKEWSADVHYAATDNPPPLLSSL